MHELQQILLKKIPRLGELTFGCVVRQLGIGYDYYTLLETFDEERWGAHCMSKTSFHCHLGNAFFKNENVEILGRPFTHADILEALGNGWGMDSDFVLLRWTPTGFTYYQHNGKSIELPSNISDLSLPEYEETRKQLIQLLTK